MDKLKKGGEQYVVLVGYRNYSSGNNSLLNLQEEKIKKIGGDPIVIEG